MKRRRPKGLRLLVVAAGTTLLALALSAATALMLLTTYLHREALLARQANESIRGADAIKLDLLAWGRVSDQRVATGDPRLDAERDAIEGDLRRRLDLERSQTRSPEEARQLSAVERGVAGYFAARRRAEQNGHRLAGIVLEAKPAVERALDDLDGFIARKDQEAMRAQARLKHWDDLANWIGLGISGLLVLGFLVTLWWTLQVLYRPLLALERAVDEQAGGRREARAPERGPAEIVAIARTLNRMADALADSETRRLEAIGGIAHDLRNPLQAIKLSTAALTRRALPPEDKLRERLSVIARQVTHLERTVSDLVDASSAQAAGEIKLHLERRDLRQLTEETVQLFEAQPGAHQLVLHNPDQPLYADVDPTRIARVLANLVSNAIKYSPQGGRITVELEEHEGVAVLSVCDQGLGIEPAELPYIFEPFRRSVRDGAIPGVGLGLSVVRSIVEAHGGHVEVESTPGVGSRFYVWLPREHAACSTSAQSLPNPLNEESPWKTT